MKMIHCADLHLDSRMRTNLSTQQAKERRMELLNTFQEMVAYADRNEVDAILVAGDLYDTRNISATARNAIRGAILGYPSIDFYYLKGNHDADGLLEGWDEIPANLRLFGSRWTTYVANEGKGGSISISGMELDRENAGIAASSLSLSTEQFNIVMLHGQETEDIPLKEFRNRGIDYLALGHVHSYKQEKLDSRGIYCYPGCLEGRGFDECGEHGFVLLEVDDRTKSFTHTFVPFAFRCLYTAEIDITGCMTTADAAERIRQHLDAAAYDPKSLLKLVLTGEVDVACEIATELLVKQFEKDYYFLKIYDESTLKVDYNAYLLDESLKGEFVRNVMAAKGLEEDDKAVIIRYGMQALAGEEID